MGYFYTYRLNWKWPIFKSGLVQYFKVEEKESQHTHFMNTAVLLSK